MLEIITGGMVGDGGVRGTDHTLSLHPWSACPSEGDWVGTYAYISRVPFILAGKTHDYANTDLLAGTVFVSNELKREHIQNWGWDRLSQRLDQQEFPGANRGSLIFLKQIFMAQGIKSY